jgi:hypothetical protein
MHIKIDMASTVEQLLNPETPPATPAVVRQPFAAKDSYFIPKLATLPVWKIGFRFRIDRKYKEHGALVFCTNDKCKNSGKLPPGHINELTLQRKCNNFEHG